MKYFATALKNPLYARPENAYTNAGVCAHLQGDDVKAEELLRKALALQPNQPQALYQLADIAFKRNDLTAARSTAEPSHAGIDAVGRCAVAGSAHRATAGQSHRSCELWRPTEQPVSRRCTDTGIQRGPLSVSDAAADAESSAAAERAGAAGAVLFKERRRQGLSLGDISRQLKLSVRQVEALERDDYSGYKSPVFIHGFIRNYAKLLGLDPEPLIRATDSMLHPPASAAGMPREQERSQPLRSQDSGIPVLARGCGRAPDRDCSIGLFRQSPCARRRARGIDGRRARQICAVVEGRRQRRRPALMQKSDTSRNRKSNPRQNRIAKPETKPEAKAEAKSGSVERRLPIAADAAAADEAAGRVTVRMIFEQDSWVEIKDRTGNTIFGQLNPAGSRRSVSGEPPLSVVVGNAAGRAPLPGRQEHRSRAAYPGGCGAAEARMRRPSSCPA